MLDDQLSLQSALAVYCLDTNVVLNFLRTSDDEPYDAEIFAAQWTHLLRSIEQFRVVSPLQVAVELEKFAAEHPRVGTFLSSFSGMFVSPDDGQLDAAREIVNAFPAYAANRNRIADLMVLALAKSHELRIITAEKRAPQTSAANPKIPDVGDALGLVCLGFKAYLVDDGFLNHDK